MSRTRLALAVVPLLLATGCPSEADEPDEPASGGDDCAFDTERWVSLDPADDGEGAELTDMAEQLMECGTLDGATRDEVAELLGGGGPEPDADRWEYSVARSFLDYTLLVVAFDESDRVTEVYWGQS
jgi:hypothetical protein